MEIHMHLLTHALTLELVSTFFPYLRFLTCIVQTKYPFVGLAINKEVLYAWTDGPKYYVAAIDLKTASYIKYKGMYVCG